MQWNGDVLELGSTVSLAGPFAWDVLAQEVLSWGASTAGLLGAAGFSSAVMLAWAAAAAIPIILHFLNRRRQQPMPWAAMQLLLQVIEKQAKRIRLEQLLLLAMRVLILLALALALAQPFLRDQDAKANADATRDAKLWIVAVDNSFSMGYREAGQNRLARAKAKVMELIEGSQPGDAFALLALSDPSQAVIAYPTFDRSAFERELQRMRVLDTGSELSGCLASIDAMLETAAEQDAIPSDIHVVLVSDLGRDCWQSAVDGPDRRALQQLQQKCSVVVEGITGTDASNLAILNVHTATNRVIIGNTLSVDVTLESVGADATRVPIQMQIDGKTVASEYVDLVEGQPLRTRLSATPRNNGSSIVSVLIPDDALSADNRRDCVIEVRRRYQILLVGDKREDLRLIQLALAPSMQPKGESGIKTIAKRELATIDLNEWDVVLLNDLSDISPETVVRLERFVRERGSLIAFFGPRTQPEQWNVALGEVENVLGFNFALPFSNAELAVDPLDYQSPIVAAFEGFPDSGLLTTPFFRLWQVKPLSEDRLKVDLATTDGMPLIVRQRVGNGWVASLLSAPQDGLSSDDSGGDVWNALASWPSFLPLLQQMIQVALDAGADRTNLLTGEVLTGVVNEVTDRSTVDITLPDGTERQVATEARAIDGGLPWFFSQTEIRGVYRVQTSAGSVQPFAVNVNTIESRLESIDPQQLPLSPTLQTVESQSPDVQAAQPNDTRLARWLLAAVFALLIAESLLAWTLGRRIG